MRKIAHIINPVAAPEGSELARVQPITFTSILNAKAHAAGVVEVVLLTTQYEEDRLIIPSEFEILPNLETSVEEVAQLQSNRKLPLLREILSIAGTNTDAEYLIYSNVDIGVDPPFYTEINRLIDAGYDGMMFHRRRVSGTYDSVEQLDAIYSDVGKPHTGFDTFVFKRELVEKFVLGDVCVGIPHVGNALAHNLFALCDNFKLFANMHLTFHIGMELRKNWGAADYLSHNKKEFRNSLKTLKPDLKIANIPGSNQGFWKRHYIWLMNPNFHYPTLFVLDFKQRSVDRGPKPSKEKHPSGYYERLVRKVMTKD